MPATEMGSPADRGGLSGNDEEFSFKCVRFEVSKILAEILSSTRVWYESVELERNVRLNT